MAEARRALTHVLSRAEPYPVFLTDRLWDVVAANDSGRRLLGLMLGEARMARPVNFMRLFLAPDELRRHIVNWPAVALAMIHRAGRDLAAATDAADLQDLWQGIAADPDVAALASEGGELPPGSLGEIRFAAQGREIGLIGLVTSFAAPLDVTLDELRIESFLPADDETDDILFRMAAPA
ncbi:MAG: hypothetical protein V4466_15455 [Pseudomonadota bacterium]